MATFDLIFSPRGTIANPPAIRTRAEELYILQARLFGQSDDLEASFNSAATQFTDIFAWNIQGAAAEDYQLWRDAGVAIAYAASKIEQWADYVEEFQDERTSQKTEWFDFRTAKEDEIPADFQGQTITATYPERGGWFDFSDAGACRDIYDQVATKLAELEGRARTNYQNFEDHADEIAEKLKEGPTKANVQELIDADINAWAFYNIDPGRYTMLVDGQELTDENAQEWADELSDYWSGDKPLDERYNELMLMMSMITTNAMQAQQGGTGYRTDEMDFLRTFYETLEAEDPNHMGVLGIPSQMEGDHLTDEERAHALGVLGDGLLALSDESIGGSYEDLPLSVRRTAEGPLFYEHGEDEVPYSWVVYQEDARALSDLLQHTNEDIQGGYELSTNLSMSSSGYTYHMGDSDWMTSEEMAPLVDVGTRNEDANYYIITGEHFDSESGVDYTELGIDYTGEERINAIEGLFTYEWHDDGATARQLTDWLAEDGDSENPDIKKRADKALGGFIDIITRPEVQEALMQTGHQIEDTLTTEDREGNEVTEEFEWRNVSMGHLNPEIADSFAGIFETYVDTFSDSSILDQNVPIPGLETEYVEDDGLVISLGDRRTFAQFIAGDTEAAERMLSITNDYTEDGIDQYFAESGDDESVRDIPRETGLLWNAVGSGISDETAYRTESHNSSLEDDKKNLGFIVDLTATGFRNPQMAETYKFFAKEFIETTVDADQQEEETRSFDDYEPVIRAQLEVGALEFYADRNSENWGNEPWSEGPFEEDMYDNNQNFIGDQHGWQNEDSSNDTDAMRDNAWDHVSDIPLPERPSRDFYKHGDEYMTTLGEAMRISEY